MLVQRKRQLRKDKRGLIPSELAPILEHIGLDANGWCDLVSKFGRYFKRAAGTRDSVKTEASRRQQTYKQAPGLTVFADAD